MRKNRSGREGLVEFEDLSLIRPIVRPRNQVLSNRIVSDVFPFLRVLIPVADPVVPVVRLPTAVTYSTAPTELRFPVPDPSVEFEFGLAERAEQMEMVGHDDVPADTPSLSFAPDGVQRPMHLSSPQPLSSVLGANREKDDDREIFRLDQAMPRMLACRTHGRFIFRRLHSDHRPFVATGCDIRLGGSLALPAIVASTFYGNSRMRIFLNSIGAPSDSRQR